MDGLLQVQALIDKEGPDAHPRQPLPWPPVEDPSAHYDRAVPPWTAPSEHIPRAQPYFERRGGQLPLTADDEATGG